MAEIESQQQKIAKYQKGQDILRGQYSNGERSKPFIAIKICETKGRGSIEARSVEYSIKDLTPGIIQVFMNLLYNFIAIESENLKELEKSYGIE